MKKKILSVALVLAVVLSLCACKKEEVPAYEDLSGLSYDEQSEALYNLALNAFSTSYEKAKATTNVSEKYALMAIAEAKLMESAVMLPTTTDGGRYAISRVAPYSVDYAMWGNDAYRYHQALVCTDFIKSEDRAEMKQKWAELKGTGTFADWQKEYLSSKGYTLKDTYATPYSSDPQTWDVLATSRAADSEAIINTYDGLMEYDVEGVLQPALAESYTVSDDGLTYTFKLRKGVTWVDSQGRKVADLVADDFVAGMQHCMDVQGGLEYLYEAAGITGVDAYMYEGASMDEVGVKAEDDYTLVYTLDAPCDFFTTMLGYGLFAPMSRSYYTSQGGKFGEEFNPEDASYTYGTTPDNIAYCGPYLVTNSTAENTIVFQANESYWNADNINVKTISWLFNDGSDPTKAYNDALAGTIEGCSLTTSTLELAKNDGNYDKYSYVSSTSATSYMAFFNLNRQAFANVNEDAVKSAQSPEEAARTNQAMRNVHFRRAVAFSVDRASYNAQGVGEDLKYNSLRNSYTPGTFVSLEEDVTVDINGKATTFKAGTFYGEIMQAQIDADGVKIIAFDPKADDGVGSSDGYDGWYNVENATKELKTAISQLKDQGLVIDENNPIHLDLPYPSNNEVYTNRAQTFKQSIEKTLDGKVVVDLTECVDYAQWYYAGYYTDYGYEANYDIYDLSGWGPDYGDPSTYLDTFLANYAGYMAKCCGIY